MAGNAMDIYRQALENSYRKKEDITTGGDAGGDAASGKQYTGIEKFLITAGAVPRAITIGFEKALEGAVDFAANIGGGGFLADMPDDSFVKKAGSVLLGPVGWANMANGYEGYEAVKDFVARDWVTEWHDKNGTNQLAASDANKTPQLLINVGEAVGGMLPSVILGSVGAGAGMSAKAAEALSLGSLGVQAAGNSTEQALNDDATAGRATLYGFAEGAKEIFTEKMFGGMTSGVFGKGFLDDVLPSAAVQGTGRVLMRAGREFAEEGMEEAVGEAAEPFLKTIYKGWDAAFEGVTVGSQAKAISEEFVLGGLTALAFGGMTNAAGAITGKYDAKVQNAVEIVEDMQAQKKKLANIRKDMSNPRYAERRQAVAERTVALYDELQSNLKSMTQEKRVELIRDLGLGQVFNEDGSYKQEMLGRIREGAGVDERYISASADAWAVREAAERAGASVVQGELDEAQRASYEALRAVENALGEQSGGTVSFGLVESLGDNEGLFMQDGNVILIPLDTLTNTEDAGKAAADFAFRKVIHEVSHFSEGTRARADVVNQISLEDRGSRDSLFKSFREDSAYDRAVDEVIRRGYVRDADGNVLDGKEARSEIERLIKAESLTESEKAALEMYVDEAFSFMTESALGTKHFAERLLAWRPGVMGELISRVHDAAERLGASGKDGTRAAVAKMQGLERSFIRSVEEAGYLYEDGEIVGIGNDGEDEEKEETRRSRKTTREGPLMDSEGNELTSEQREFFKDSKIRDENGRLRVVYHGTSEDFTVFNPDFIGMASGDSGYFGKGFYFAYTEGEAEYYGSRNIIKAYLNIERPFDFEKEFYTYNGERADIGNGPDMVALVNLSEKFPDIGKKVKLTAQKNGHSIEITANDLGTLFRRFMKDKTFVYGEESDAEGNAYVTVKADPKEFKETINGNEFSWTEYEYEGEFVTKPNTVDTVSDYISSTVFDRIRVPNLTQVILDNNTEFTDELKKRGYDGTVQSEEGDEACAFYSEQIKNVTNQNPTKNPDIRYSRRVTAEQDAAYMEAVEAGDMETAQRMVEEAAYNANYIVKGYHGTPNGGFTVFGGKKTRNGAPEAGSYWFTEDEAHAEAYRTYTEWGRMAENPQTYKVYLKIGEWAPIGNGRVEALDYNRDGAGAATKELKDVAKQIVLRTGFKHRNESERTRITRVTKRLTEIAREIYADNVWQVTETKQFAELCKMEGLSAVMAVEEDKGTWGGERRMVKTWGVFDNSQIKSAEPVVYDDDGNVIPLSERFNEEKSDIRWSKKAPAQQTKAQMEIGEKRRADIRAENEMREKLKAEKERADRVINRGAARSVYSIEESNEMIRDTLKLATTMLYEQATETSLGMEPVFKRFMDKKAADRLWARFNDADNQSQARNACNEIADMILANTSIRQTLSDEVVQEAREYVEVLKGYKHKLDLSGIEADLRSMFDKRYRDVMRDWSRKEGGISVDTVKADIEERLGIMIDAENPADIFKWIDETYGTMQEKMSVMIAQMSKVVSGEYWQEVRRAISDNLMEKYRRGGKITSVSEILMDVNEYRTRLEKEVASYKRMLDAMKEDVRRAHEGVEWQRAANKAVYLTQEIRHWKTGEFQAASEVGNQQMLPVIQSLSGVIRAGNISATGVRDAMKRLYEWYRTDEAKEFLAASKNKDGVYEGGYYSAVIEEKLERLGGESAEGALSLEDVMDLCDVLQYSKKLVEDFHKVRIDGKRQDAKEYSEKMQKVILSSRNVVSDRSFGQIMQVYLEEFADPMSVARYFDGYNKNGFLQSWMQRFREAEFTTELYKYNLTMPVKEFLDANPKYLKETEKRTVSVEGHQVPVMAAMYLELALMRDQAIPHIMINGFSYLDVRGKEQRVAGLMGENHGDMDNMRARAERIARDIHGQLTEADKQFLGIAIKLFNQECRNLKAQTDRARFGFTNVETGMYVPIRISDRLTRVDKGSSYREEIDRATNASFNKNVTKNANNKLEAGSLYSVLTRHIDGVARYAGLSEAIADYEQVLNINTSENKGSTVNINNTLKKVWGSRQMKAFGGRARVHGAVEYMNGLIEDIQKIHPNDATTMVDGFVAWLRGKYAVAVLGANPKVLMTQFSSLFASTSILDGKYVARAFAMQSERAEIDKYCKLAMLRNADNSAAKAMTLVDQATSKIGEAAMSLIGKMDNTVVAKLWTACRLQVADEMHAAFDSEECKVAAGQLLTRVIYETQQNSQMTERSYAMRSESSLAKIFTMFSADAMKVIGRVMDAAGEARYISREIKAVSDPAMIEKLGKDLEAAKHKQAKAIGALLSSAAYMAVITTLVRKLLARDDDDTFEAWSVNDIWTFLGDMLGSAVGGLPVIKEAVELLGSGYEVTDMGVDTFNQLLQAVNSLTTVLSDSVQGKATEQEIAKAVRSIVYSVSSAYGLPVRNVFKWLRGIGYYITPEAVMRVDSIFTNKSYTSALAEAVANGNDRRAEMIAGIMVDQKVDGAASGPVRREMIRLAAAGQTVLPQTFGGTITYEGQQYQLKARQKKDFEAVYDQAGDACEKMVATKYYRQMDDAAKAAAIKRVYSLYWNMGIEAVLGVDIESKALYMAKAIPAEKLACITAQASLIKSDVDASGKVVQGTKKAKVASFLQGLQLTAAQKYMIYGYLGYENKAGEAEVRRYVQSIRATVAEKNAIMKAAGY